MQSFKKDLYIVANFGELFLKGKNIGLFETKLFYNLTTEF